MGLPALEFLFAHRVTPFGWVFSTLIEISDSTRRRTRSTRRTSTVIGWGINPVSLWSSERFFTSSKGGCQRNLAQKRNEKCRLVLNSHRSRHDQVLLKRDDL